MEFGLSGTKKMEFTYKKTSLEFVSISFYSIETTFGSTIEVET